MRGQLLDLVALQSKGMALLDRNATKCFGGLLRRHWVNHDVDAELDPSERGKARQN